MADEWFASPVLGDVAEESVLDLVPFAGARREVAHGDTQPRLISEVLQGDVFAYLPLRTKTSPA